MNLQRTILNMRNASRSNNIRNEQDPAKVAAQLESILFETINMQNTGSREFQIRALKELKQLRSDMTTGQINAGSKGHQYVGLYSHVIDQIERLTADSEKTNSAFTKGLGSIKDSMPSTDSLIAALMTANPIVGYGAKIMRDISRTRKEAKSKNDDEAKKRLTMLKEQEKYLKSQLEAQESEDGTTEEAKTDELENGLYLSLLEEIRDEIKLLESYWRGDGDRLSESTDVIDSQLENLDDHLVDQIDSAEDAEAARIRNERLSRFEDTDAGDIPIIDEVDTSAQRENKGGLLEGILGAPLRLLKGLALGFTGVIAGIAGIFGIGAAASGAGFLAKLLSPIKSLVGFVFSIGRFALSIGSKLLLPAAILVSLFDFFDAFFNADEILGKNDSDITLGDRVLVGIANVIARFGELLDSVLEMFDIDLFDSTDLTKTIYDFFVSIPERIGALIDSIMNTITTAIDDSIARVKSIVDSIMDTFNGVYEAIENKITEWGDSLKSLPGIGSFFDSDETETENVSDIKVTVSEPIDTPADKPDIKLNDDDVSKAKADLSNITSTDNMLSDPNKDSKPVLTMIPIKPKAVDASTEDNAKGKLDKQESDKNLVQVGTGTATIVPTASNSQSTADTIQSAERAAQAQPPMMNNTSVNAPTNVNNNSKTIQSGNTTSNPNNIHRKMNEMNYGSR